MRNATNTIRVLLVDDHLLFRDGIASLLERDGQFQVVGQAGNGKEALEACERLAPDLVLMDIQMPGMGGLEATRLLLDAHPDLKVVMLTVSDKDQDLFEAVKAGAQGYLLKTATAGKEMCEAISQVAAGEAIIPSGMAHRLLAEFAALAKNGPGSSAQTAGEEALVEHAESGNELAGQEPEAEIDLLTPREHEVLELVAEGLTNKEIAARLVISENTVRTHLRCILDKLHLNSRVQAAMWLRDQRSD